MNPIDADGLAERLDHAWAQRATISPPGAAGELTSVEDAYAVQQAWARRRTAAGDRRVGRKIGLTSPGMQRQMGVAEPDFGDLWESRRFDGPVVPTDRFIQPRVEGEVAFLMERDLEGPDVDEAAVLDAAGAAAPAIEIVDSRIADWRISLVDTVADNASFGGFVTGPWSRVLLEADLPVVPFQLARGEAVVVAETGAAVLGSPLTAVAWLARRLADFGQGIAAGDVVLSGSFGGAVPVTAGDVFTLTTPGLPALSVRFA
jgi:2-keto-4-pentenoate hydratase